MKYSCPVCKEINGSHKFGCSNSWYMHQHTEKLQKQLDEAQYKILDLSMKCDDLREGLNQPKSLKGLEKQNEFENFQQ